MDNEFIIAAMDNNHHRAVEEGQNFSKKIGMLSSKKLNNLAEKLAKKTVEYLSYSKEYELDIPIGDVSLILKKEIDDKKYAVLKETYSNNTLIFYIDIFYLELNYKGGLAIIEVSQDKKVGITLFYRRQFKLNSLNIEKTFLYFEEIIGVTDTAAEIDNTISDENNSSLTNEDNSSLTNKDNNSIDSYKHVKDTIYPLEESVYLEREYIHPSLKVNLNIINEYDEIKYEDAKRTILNNNYRFNKLNRYAPAIIASNPYQERTFPIVAEHPDLEEFSDEYVWHDEKIFFHTFANEYLPYGSPDTYMSTTTSFGNVSFGSVSFKEGKDNIGWGCMSSGDFYITERQIIIFEKGKFSLIGHLLDADNYKRDVISIFLNDINVVEGETESGRLKIYKKNSKMHAFEKSNSNREKIKFSEDELRYMVNLIGSLIEKKL